MWLSKWEYEYLNQLTNKVIQNNKEYLKYLPMLRAVGLFIIDSVKASSNSHKYTTITYQESLEIVEEFLAYYSPELLANYLNIKSLAEKIEFVSEYASKYQHSMNNSGLRADGTLRIYLKGNMEDAFVIAHEFMHAIFSQKIDINNVPFNLDFLSEVNSLTIELLLAQYLEFKGYEEDAKKGGQDWFIKVKAKAYQAAFEAMLIDIITDEKRINDDTLCDYIFYSDDRLRAVFATFKDDCLKNTLTRGFNLKILNRYIIALFLACYLKQEIVGTHDLSKLLTIGTAIYQQDLRQALERIGLNFFDVSVTKNILGKIKREDIYFNEDIDIFKWAFLKEYQNIQTRSR